MTSTFLQLVCFCHSRSGWDLSLPSLPLQDGYVYNPAPAVPSAGFRGNAERSRLLFTLLTSCLALLAYITHGPAFSSEETTPAQTQPQHPQHGPPGSPYQSSHASRSFRVRHPSRASLGPAPNSLDIPGR